MPIEDYYTTLAYYPPTYGTDRQRKRTYLLSEKVTFQGLVNQSSSTSTGIAGHQATMEDAKLFCAVTVEIDRDYIVQYGINYFRVMGHPMKNTVGRNHHHKIMLQSISPEQIDITDDT